MNEATNKLQIEMGTDHLKNYSPQFMQYQAVAAPLGECAFKKLHTRLT